MKHSIFPFKRLKYAVFIRICNKILLLAQKVFLWSCCGKNWSSRESRPVQGVDNHLLYCQGSNMGWDVRVCDIYHRARWSALERCEIPLLIPRTLEASIQKLPISLNIIHKLHVISRFILYRLSRKPLTTYQGKYTSLPSLSFSFKGVTGIKAVIF